MPEEKKDSKPTPRINASTTPKSKPEFRLATEKEMENVTPSAKVGTPTPKPIVSRGAGFQTPRQGGQQVSNRDERLLRAATQGAQRVINENFKIQSIDEQLVREKELENISGKDLTFQNLYTAVHNSNSPVPLSIGGGKYEIKVNNADELGQALQDPYNLDQFYQAHRSELAQFFKIGSAQELTNKLQGGLTQYEKAVYSNQDAVSVYDPRFDKPYLAANAPRYSSSMDQFAPDPVAEKYGSVQKRIEADQNFNTLRENNLNVDAYGQPIDNAADFYEYLKDPINRDSYGRVHKKKLNELGFTSAQDLFAGSYYEKGKLTIDLARYEDQKEIRRSNAERDMATEFLNRNATVFDENDQSSSVPKLDDEQIGKMLYESELGNHISFDYQDPNYRSSYKKLDRESFEDLLRRNNLDDYEVGEILEEYKLKYLNNMVNRTYEEKRKAQGFIKNEKGQLISNYDQIKENRAQAELSKEEREIAALYDQVQEIYKSGKKVKGKNQVLLPAEKLKQLQALKAQISQKKQEAGFLGLNVLPQQEFFDAFGNRLEGKQQSQVVKVFTQTAQAEQKTDLAILKEKRNVLYEQVDYLNDRFQNMQNKKVVLPENYNAEELDAEYNAMMAENGNFFQKALSFLSPVTSGMGAQQIISDQQKANAIYLAKLNNQIVEKKAQIKALNRVIYTNADITKLKADGIVNNMVSGAVKNTVNLIEQEQFQTPAEEVLTVANYLTEQGMYVNPEVVESLQKLQEDSGLGQGFLTSLTAGLQIGLMRKPVANSTKALFTSEAGVVARTYMANKYGQTGVGVFTLFEKAAVNYGVDFLAYELAGQEGGMGVAEKVGSQLYDKTTSVLNFGRIIPNNLIGRMATLMTRSFSGAAASMTEETFSNIWSEFKANGFDIVAATENAYGKTEDERLFNKRATALMCMSFSALNLENLGILFKTTQAYQEYVDRVYGDNVDPVDVEIIKLLNQTIKESDYDDENTTKPDAVTAPVMAVSGVPNTTNAPAFAFNPVMTSGPVDENQNTTTSTSASTGVGTEGVKVEKRAGNLGEEFYVSSANGVVDNKVIYRYNPETNKLEAKGLTSVTDEFVEVNDKTAEFIDKQSKEYGIVSKATVENVAKTNLGIDSEAEGSGQVDKDKVLFQNNTATGRSKKDRIDRATASSKTRYASQFNTIASQIMGLFTNTAKEADVNDDAVRTYLNDISRKVGNKLKINMTSFIKDGVVYISNASRMKLNKVASYVAPLLKEFDDTLFTTEDYDLNTGEPIRKRNANAVTDKVRESVSRNTFFNEVFGDMINDGRITKEDAIDNFIGMLLINNRSKVKEILGNDRFGLDAFTKLRNDFNNFVAVKYTGASTFNTTEKFLNRTAMSASTTKNRKSDIKKQILELEKEKQKRYSIKKILISTQKEGTFVTDDQVDAAMFLAGDLSAEDFLLNMGVETKANETPDQVREKAKKQAEKLIDYAKYTDGKRLVAENDATREKYRKELNKKFKDDWGFKASFKTRFRWKKMRQQRTASAEAALRIFENKATRMGITLKEYMDTRIGMLKRTEQQFQDWLKMSPNLVPLFQNAANLNPEDIYPNVNKAKELREKNYTPEKIAFMTGVILNESGNPVAFDPKFVADSVVKSNIYLGVGNAILKIREQPKFRLNRFGKRTINKDVSTVFDIKSLFTYATNKELYDLYPDLGLVSIRTVNDPNLPAVFFRPNYMYQTGGDAKQGEKPGEIVINLQKYEPDAITNIKTNYKKLFTKNILPQVEQSLRQAVQHIEGELPESTINFTTPTVIRTKLIELRSKKLIDQATEKLVNDIVDFYVDKNLFQFTSYKSVLSDISRVLFATNTEKGVKKIVESISNIYDLSVSDSETLESIYNNYMNSYGEGDANKAKSLHNAFLVLNSFTGLNNEELIAADVTELKFVQGKASSPVRKEIEGSPTQAELIVKEQKLIFERFANNLKQLDNATDNNAASLILGIIDAEKQYGSGYGNRVLEISLNAVMEVIEVVDDIRTLLDNNEVVPNKLISKLESAYSGQAFADGIKFLYTLDADTELNLDDGTGVKIFTDPIELDEFLYVDGGVMINDPMGLDTALTKMIPQLKKATTLTSKLKSEVTEFENITDAEARESFYELFPGIENYMGGIYNPYKSISDFTKAELQKQLVDSGLVSQEKFNEVYSNYEVNPKEFTGSVASNFMEATAPLAVAEQQKLAEFLKVQELIEDSFSTSFYSGVAYATSKVIVDAGKNGTIPVDSLKPLLIKNGAKEVELNWIGFDDFISQYDKTIPASDLKIWSENIPQLFSYDRDSLEQSRTIDEIIYLGGGEFEKIEVNRVMLSSDLNIVVRNAVRTIGNDYTGVSTFAIKRSDGTVRFVDLNEIKQETLDLYESYIGKEKYPQFKETFEKLQKTQTTPNVEIADETLGQIETLLKLHFEASDEIIRQKRLESYESYKSDIGEIVPGTYKEHTLGFPFRSNRLLSLYDARILEVLEKIKKGNKSIEELIKLRDELSDLQLNRNEIAADYFNKAHFTAQPNEVAVHMRTQIVTGADGERMLHVIEMQSDKAQDFRDSVLKRIKRKFPVNGDLEQRIIGLLSIKENKNITKEELLQKLEQLEIDNPIGISGLNEQLNNYFLKQVETKKAKDNFKKTSPILETEQYVNIALKHALKIASDSGVKKIVLSNGASIGIPVAGNTVGDTASGLNKLYNETIPNKAKKLANNYGFTVGTVKLNLNSFGKVDELFAPDKFEFVLDPKEYPSFVDKSGRSVVNTGNPLTRAIVDEEFLNYVALETKGEHFIPGSEFVTLELSDETFEQVAGGMALFQQDMHGAHGATVKTDQGKHIIFALTNPNITTAMHELAHVWEDSLTAIEKRAFLKEVGHNKWTRATSEAFARGFEKYLADGKAPTPSLSNLFDNFKKWFLQIYGGIIGTPIEMKVTEPMRKLYDSMLGETQVKDVQMKKTPNVIEDIGNFIRDIKENPQFKGITDEELYAALMKSGFEPDDIKDYFSLKQRANIEKQKAGKGLFEDEATVMENEEDAIRVVRDKKELLDAIENIEPTEYPMLLKTLFDVLESGDVLLAKEIELLLKAKHSGADPQTIREQYAAILKTGTQVGRMLRLFRQLTQDTYTTSTQAMIDKLLKKGESIPEKAKEDIMSLAREVDRLKELYKASREQAMNNPYGQSTADPNMSNFDYHKDLYSKLQEATEKYIAARTPYEGSESKTDAFRSFIKGGLMTPGSLSVNTASNIVKLFVGFFTDPLRSTVSYIGAKTGLVDKQYTRVTWADMVRGIKYGMPMGVKKGIKILRDGSVSQGYVDGNNYAQGFNSFKAFSSYFGLKLDQMKRAAGYSTITDEELAYKHGFRINALGKIPDKQQSVRALEATFGIIPDIIFRVMAATDAVFRDFAYMTSVSEDFKQSPQAMQLEKRIKSTSDKAAKKKLIDEYNALRKAFLVINQDFGNPTASEEALRFVYANDNWVTEQFARIQRGTRNMGEEGSIGSFTGKIARLFGTGTIPFTKIPTNYAVELAEFLVPEYALFKVANAGKKAYDRNEKLKSGSTTAEAFAEDRKREARDMDRVMARALVGAGMQYIALEFVKAGALSGGPQDEKEDDKIKSSDYSYQYERPYSINVTLVKEHFKELMGQLGIGEPYKSTRLSKVWDRENDFIIDYRGFGVLGAALYFQYKENKHKLQTEPKFVNRGAFEQITDDFASSLFGNYESAYKYIIDQTFVRGVLSIAKAISDDDENKLPNFFADITLTMASAIVPNSLSWIDKWRREYAVDYDARDAEPFKAFGIQVQNEAATLYFTKLATKLSERWPFGDPTKYVNLPFIESNREILPVKIDPFGKRILQTPEGSVLGKFMYNTFDLTKATEAYAGYSIPDWEALCNLCCKMEAWNALPSALPRKVSTPSGEYKMTPDEYNNILEYNAMLRRQMVQDILIDRDRYKELIDMQSSYNRREDGTLIMGISNPKTPFGFELLARIMSDIYTVSNQMTLFANYTFIDKEREKLYRDDPERYMRMVQTEMLTATKGLAETLYGGQELGEEQTNNYVGGFMNITDRENLAGNKFFSIDKELIRDPQRFKKFATGAIELVKQFDLEGKSMMQETGSMQGTQEKQYIDVPLGTPKPKTKQPETKVQQNVPTESGYIDIPLE